LKSLQSYHTNVMARWGIVITTRLRSGKALEAAFRA